MEPTVPMPTAGKRKGKKRKTNGYLFVRNFRPAVKEKFKATVINRGEKMADVIEAMMILYCSNPEIVRAYLPEVKMNRRRSNR
jgi:hypothetical protein